jgi:hypothetical protein
MSTKFWNLVTEVDFFIYRELISHLQVNTSVIFLVVYQYVVGFLNAVLPLVLVAKLEMFEKRTPLPHGRSLLSQLHICLFPASILVMREFTECQKYTSEASSTSASSLCPHK